MAGLQDYLNAQEYDEELNPVPLDLSSYEAVSGMQGPQMPMPEIPAQQSAISPALQKYLDLSAASAEEERAGVEQLQNYLTEYQAKPQGTDFRPLATLVDQLSPRGGNATQRLAEQMAPESEDARQQKIMQLQDMIQNRRQGMTKTQMGMLQAQLAQEQKKAQQEQAMQLAKDKFAQQKQLQEAKLEQEKLRTQAYKEGIASRERIAAMQAEAAKAARKDAQAAADARENDKQEAKKELKVADQVAKIGKDFSGEIVDMTKSLGDIEGIIGANIDTYDPKARTLNGKPVDLPGKSILGFGRMYKPGSEGERLQAAFLNINNALLKARSGAAVTEQEFNRLKGELGTGKFNTEEQMLESVQRFKRALRETMEQRERSYMPEATARFREQGGKLTSDFFGIPTRPPAAERKEWPVGSGRFYEKQGDSWVEVGP